MARKIAITPNKCIGCSACVLQCAITYSNSFDLKKSHIKVVKNDFEGLFYISFSSSCRNCCQCAAVCPSQCLTVVEIVEDKGEGAR